MNVKLISYTQPVNKDFSFEDLISYCARVSNPSNQNNTETAEKLIKYLIRHKHWSPFEMVNVCLEIETTRDIARQILRHRSFSFQEFSQRYADPNELGFFFSEARLQDQKNRQASIDVEDQKLQFQWRNRQKAVAWLAKRNYQWALKKGIAKEVARKVLPEGLMGSRMYMNGTLRSWIHYLEVREDISTQKEHRGLAHACAYELIKVFPLLNEVRNG